MGGKNMGRQMLVTMVTNKINYYCTPALTCKERKTLDRFDFDIKNNNNSQLLLYRFALSQSNELTSRIFSILSR